MRPLSTVSLLEVRVVVFYKLNALFTSIIGCKATIYAMDLVYTKIYRLHNVTTFNIPHGRHDLTRL